MTDSSAPRRPSNPDLLDAHPIGDDLEGLEALLSDHHDDDDGMLLDDLEDDGSSVHAVLAEFQLCEGDDALERADPEERARPRRRGQRERSPSLDKARKQARWEDDLDDAMAVEPSRNQDQEPPCFQTQYDQALRSLAESMRRTEQSRLRVVEHRRSLAPAQRMELALARERLREENERVVRRAREEAERREAQRLQAQQQQAQQSSSSWFPQRGRSLLAYMNNVGQRTL
ncbi:hypothetical protein ACHAWF_015225 [Thalassiosira exigua]